MSTTKSADKDNHIVYVATYGSSVMYVGEGQPNRFKHLTSGTSHVYMANKHHFEGKTLKVEVVFQGLTKKESLVEEKKLIEELSPKWNKDVLNSGEDYISRKDQMTLVRKLSREFEDIRKSGGKGLVLLKFLVGQVNGSVGYWKYAGDRHNVWEWEEGTYPITKFDTSSILRLLYQP